MMNWRSLATTVATISAALSISACALNTEDGVTYRPFTHWCDEGSAKIIKSADWSKAKTIDLTIIGKEYDSVTIPIPDEKKPYKTEKYHRALDMITVNTDVFVPQFTTLKKDHPYILKIKNTDKTSRTFYAFDFFTDMAVSKVVNAGRTSKRKCIFAIIIPGNKSAEVHFVASKEGRYEVEDNAVLIMPGLGPVAFITIK